MLPLCADVLTCAFFLEPVAILAHLNISTMSNPYFRVNAHVFYYTLMFGISVGAAVGVSKAFTKPEKDRLEALEQKYPELVQKSKLQRQQMQEFFDKVSGELSCHGHS